MLIPTLPLQAQKHIPVPLATSVYLCVPVCLYVRMKLLWRTQPVRGKRVQRTAVGKRIHVEHHDVLSFQQGVRGRKEGLTSLEGILRENQVSVPSER